MHLLVELDLMLFSQPDYAPDLEWMLQSGQVTPEVLIEALVQEFYIPIYRFVYAYLDERRTAIRVTNETFSKAISELHSYRPQDGVDIWLFRIAIQICQNWRKRILTRRALLAFLPFLSRPEDFGDSIPQNEREANIWLGIDGLENGVRQAVILHYLLEWSNEQIATLRDCSSGNVDIALEKARDLIAQIGDENVLIDGSKTTQTREAIDQHLSTTLKKRWPLPKTNQDNIDRLINRINKRAGRISKRMHGLTYVMEIAVISLIILVGASLAWGTNRVGSNRVAKTPNSMVITVIITEYVYEYITATPSPQVIITTPTPTSNLVQSGKYVLAQTNDNIDNLAAREGIPVQSLQRLNRIPDDGQLKEGDRLLRPVQWSNLLVKANRKLNLTEPAPALQPPYLGEEILKRLAIQGPQYDTLWFDAQIIDYGPGSYVGPARLLHTQTWLDGKQSLSLVGYHDQLPAEALMHNAQGTFIAKLASSQPWFYEWSDYNQDTDESLTIYELKQQTRALFDTRDLERGSTFSVFGREMQADIQALRFDVHNPEGKLTDRIWYDEQRGFILRRIQFLPGDPDTPLFDVLVEKVAYNNSLPSDFFDIRIPWRGGFSKDSSGAPASIVNGMSPVYTGRIRLPEYELPINLDPATSNLQFQYPINNPVDSPFSPVEVFASHFLLGKINFGNPWTMQCDRSADGNWLAFDSRPLHPYTYTHYLNLINLANVSAPAQHLEQSANVGVFAFSPDSKSLAFFSQPLTSEKGTLYIYDLITEELKTIIHYSDVKSLVWSPDGSNLGMIARPEIGSYVDYVVVYDLLLEKITYSTPVDYGSNAFQDWPMLDWGVEFPVEMGGMDECAAPPAG